MRKPVLVVVFWLYAVVTLPAQRLDSLKTNFKPKRDTLYIQEQTDKFYVKPLLTSRSISLEMEDTQNRVDNILYEPTTNTYLGLGLYLFDIGLELSFQVDNKSQDPAIYGETDAFDFQANLYLKKWGADIAWQRYLGFYLDDPNDHFSDWRAGDPFPQRADLNITNLQFNAFYVFNHRRFSYRSAFNQADIQLKSAGSFLLGFSTSTLRFNSDSTLIPGDSESLLPDELNINIGRFTALGLVPGYTHNLIYRNFYLNLSLSIGPAHLWTRYSSESRETNDLNIRPIVNIRSALGYNSDTFFGGLSFVSQGVGYEIGDLEVNARSGNVKLFVGYRFQEWGLLKKRLF